MKGARLDTASNQLGGTANLMSSKPHPTPRRRAGAEVYVQFRGNAVARQQVQRLATATARPTAGPLRACGSLGRLLADGRVVAIEPLFGSCGAGKGQPLAELCALMEEEKQPETGTCILHFRSPADATAALPALQRNKHLRYAHLGVVKRTAGAPDPLRNRQWALTAIELARAQQRKHFNPAAEVKIGVIDTGVDADHPDLQAARITQQQFTRGRLRDKDGHGTHVIGTIAAVANNRLGICGVTQSKQLTSLKVLDPFDLRGYFRALRYAIQQRIQVLNISLQGPATATEQQLIRKAIRRGMVVVAAMGNGGSAQRSYPAAYRNVIAVGATTPADQLWRKSNRGAHIDLVAPGTGILSTVPRYATRRAHQTLYDAEGWDGTSMAAALVTGCVALCLAHKPTATVGEIRRALHAGADFVPGQTGFTHRLGHGRLNVDQTLAAL